MSEQTTEIKIKTTYDGSGAQEALSDQEKLEQAGGGGGAPSAADRAYKKQMEESAAAAMQGPDTKAAARARVKASYEAERAAVAKQAEGAQEKFNDQLVKEEARRQGQEARAAVAAERKKKADELRAGRGERGRSWTEDRMQEQLNERLVREEQRKQAQAVTEEKRKQHAVEKLQTQEHREREALAKAQESRRTRIGRAALGLAENVTGGSQVGNMAGVAMGGGVAGTIVAAVVAATAGLAAAFAKQRDASTLIGLEASTGQVVQSRKMMRQAGFEGSAGGSREQAESFRDEINERIAKRAEIEERNRTKWYSPSSWLANLTGSAGNEAAANENAIKLAQAGERQARDTQYKKAHSEVMPEIEMAERQAAMDFKGSRAVEDKLTRYREIKRLMDAGIGDPEMAARGADAKVANIQRERAGQFARLIGTRDGAGDTARVAGLARDQRLAGAQYADPAKSIESLRADVNRNHAAATSSATRRDFTQRG